MFEEKEEVDVTVKASGHLEVRTANVVFKDGVEIARTYHREVLEPGEPTVGKPDIVKALAPVAWTEEKIAKHKARMEANESESRRLTGNNQGSPKEGRTP
jgi:hypothetical protein